MLVELPTAFVYFGAISAILAARPALPAQIALIVLYNLLFVAPLIALIVARRFAGERAIDWLVDVEARLKRVAQVALTGLAGAGGAALLAIGVTGLLAT
jgi:Sap, sulfolipid-1-addressing protein